MDTGVVKEILDENRYLVKIILQEECSSCQIKSDCHGDDSENRELQIISDEILKVGDEVEISVKSRIRIITSILLFLFPIILALFFYFLSFRIFNNEIISIISSFVGIAFSFVIVFFVVKNDKALKKYIPMGKKKETY